MSHNHYPNTGAPLTPRETTVCEYLTAGMRNKEIGAQLGISPRTVEVHRASIFRKMGVSNVALLVHAAAGASRPNADA